MSTIKTPDGHEGITVAITYATGALGVMFMYTCRFSKAGEVIWEREATPEVIDAEIVKAFDTPGNRDRLPVQKWRILPGAMDTTDPYRGAWKDDGAKIVHDMGKAKEIHRDRLRRDRALLLADLDTEYLRADEAGNQVEKQRIATRKQELRDVTSDPRIEAAVSVEELKAITI